MARKQNTYVCPVKEVTSAGEWTKNGAGLQAKVEGETPNGTDSYSVAANSKTLTGLFQMPTLAAGEIVMSVQAFVYGKAATSAADVEVLAKPSAITLSETTAAWHSTAVVNEEGTSPAELESFSLKSIKIAGGTVYAIYIVVKTETERNWASGTPVKARTASATAEGTAASGTTGGSLVAGRTAILYAAVAGANGATSITDPSGNTWTKDGEQKHGSALTVQIWSSLLTTEIPPATAVTLNGLPASAPFEVFLSQGLTAMVASSKVDVSAGAEGTGTLLEVTTPAMRATQGDWVAVLYGTTANTVTFTPSGFSGPAAMNFAQAGLSTAGGMINKPTEGATVAAKGTFSLSGEMAALVVAYKVLGSAGVTLATSGGGSPVAAQARGALRAVAASAGGSAATAQSRAASRTVLASGGGLPVVSLVAARSTTVKASGGGGASVAFASGRRALVSVSGGARVVVSQARGAVRAVAASGGPGAAVTRARGALRALTTSGGASVSTSQARGARVALSTAGGPRVTMTLRKAGVSILTSGGPRATITYTVFAQTPLFPSDQPVAGRVAQGRGRMAVAGAGRLDSPDAGHAR